MRKIISNAVLLIIISGNLCSQDIGSTDKAGLEKLMLKETDTVFVVKFWATWCSPCVTEIGYFEEVHRLNQGNHLQVILVSLDFPNQAEKRVIPFLKEKEITAPVVLMTDLRYNEWIDQVDPTWSGAIPATLIYNKDQRIFLEQELTRDELFKHVKQILN